MVGRDGIEPPTPGFSERPDGSDHRSPPEQTEQEQTFPEAGRESSGPS